MVLVTATVVLAAGRLRDGLHDERSLVRFLRLFVHSVSAETKICVRVVGNVMVL